MQLINVEYQVYYYREKRDLTVRQLAELSGVSKTEINDIENGKKHPTVPILYKISLALEVPFGDLFTVEIT